MKKRDVLATIRFGERVAEEESDVLATYFVETDIWNRLFAGDIDVVYGAKGAGKSALYSLLSSRREDLRASNVILVQAENPRGATAFRDLATEPPASEREFVALWKLYFAALLHAEMVAQGVSNAALDRLGEALAREGLIKGQWSLARLLKAVGAYVHRLTNATSLEGELKVDPHSGMPTGVAGKIVLGEPETADPQVNSVDMLLDLASRALDQSSLSAWILLDRLDVAFADHEELEANALRALFRAYLDIRAYSQIKLKIFLRTDIWKRISDSGFREASHITRHVTISWGRASLLNLVVRRLLHNESARRFYNVSESLANSSTEEQENLFDRVFPKQVDVGTSKSLTLDWLLSRTRDGTQLNAPRELIHFMNRLREVQIQRFEIGQEAEPDGEQLFTRASFKESLPEVSTTRLNQTLYSEHPDLKPWIDHLKGEKTSQTLETLSSLWKVPVEEALAQATKLASVGFFEIRGPKDSPSYWVPFLYRDALKMVQGAAD